MNYSDSNSTDLDISALSRAQLRLTLRQRRQQLSSNDQTSAAQALVTQVLASAWSTIPTQTSSTNSRSLAHPEKPTKIALYLSNDGEISPEELCQLFWQQNIHCYLPVIQGETLVFAHYHNACEWQENQFGIAEPIDPLPVDGLGLDYVFLPLVGFDKQGGRLGMGGGYYDKTFANKVKGQAPFLIGLAHDCQEVTALPTEAWDVPLDAILTPTQNIIC